MGMSPGFLDLVGDLVREGLLAPRGAILDVGASELFCAEDPAALNRLLAVVGAPAYAADELAAAADRSFARGLLERAGFAYAAIDFADFPGVLRLDLNRDALPAEHRGRYALVANCGTSEHVLNQWNAFQVIHDAAAPGAVIYHGVPGWGDLEHGIIMYAPKFFTALAHANDYEVLRFWGWSDGAPAPLGERYLQRIAFDGAPPIAEKVWLHVLLRKRGDRPFAGFSDPGFSREWRSPRATRLERSLAGRIAAPAAHRLLRAGRWAVERFHAWSHR